MTSIRQLKNGLVVVITPHFEKDDLLTLTIPEMTKFVGGMRGLTTNSGQNRYFERIPDVSLIDNACSHFSAVVCHFPPAFGRIPVR